VDLLGCGHVAVTGSGRMCRHLVDPGLRGRDHARHLLGTGLDADYLCRDCDRTPAGAELVEACEGCFGRLETGCIAWRGAAGIAERPEPVTATLVLDHLPPIVDLAPIDDTEAWMVLLEGGVVARFEDGLFTPLGVTDLALETGRATTRLRCSPGGELVAVVHDHGRHGQLLHVDSGLMRPLDAGDYHSQTVPFSLAFLDDTRVITRTGWNRLVVLDARTGEEHSWTDDELDYFHGALQVSPGGRWVADDGWIWAPIGIVRVWDADLADFRDLCDRSYHWSSPMCWLGEDLLVVSGLGDDANALLPGVRVFDVPTGTELIAFPGPAGELFAAGRRLYSASPGGLEIWDPFTGERTGGVAGFHPQWHHRGRGELAAVVEGRLVRWPINS
jgi:hypothetical protein